MIPDWSGHIDRSLAELAEQHLIRERRQLQSAQGVHVVVGGQSLLNFSSNDYLGLANHPAIVDSFIQSAKSYGVGAGASHLVCGHHQTHAELEQMLADWTGRERAVVFSSGYMANLGVLQALLGEADFVLADKLNHASLVDGVLASKLRLNRYRHCDLVDLKRLAERECARNREAALKGVIVSDSVFSMDGDIADLPALSELAKENNSLLMVDDAHGLGVLGESGAGCSELFGLSQQDLPVLVGTFGKALGCSGAFVAGGQNLMEWLVQKARNYIYTTAMPPAQASAIMSSIQLVRADHERRSHLAALIEYFSERLASFKFSGDVPAQLKSTTAIQPIVIGSSEKALALSAALRYRGFLVVAIRPPTVPVNTARLRVSLSAAHSFSQIDQLLDAFEYEARQFGVLV